MRCTFVLLVLTCLVASCNRKAAYTPRKPTGKSDPEIAEFLAESLKKQGVGAIITGKGVVLEGVNLLMKGEVIGTTESRGARMANLHMQVTLPDGHMVTDNIAGIAQSESLAKKDALKSFSQTSLPVFCGAYLKPGAGVTLETWELKGRHCEVVAGEWQMRGKLQKKEKQLDLIHQEIQRIVLAERIDPSRDNWVKLIVGIADRKIISLELSINNRLATKGTEKLRAYAWPEQKEFYMLKRFIIIRASTSAREQGKP